MIPLLFLLALPLAVSAGWQLQSLPPPPPLRALAVWAPVPPLGVPRDLVVLLHGSQSSAADPTWMAWLRERSPFRERVLVVPVVADARTWSAPATVGALRDLVGQETVRHGVSRERTFLVGFSTGASQGFSVAAALADLVGGFGAFAGYPSRSTTDADLAPLAKTRVLLACMALDTSAPCASQGPVQARLQGLGVGVALDTVPGKGHEGDLDALSPVLARWMDSVQ